MTSSLRNRPRISFCFCRSATLRISCFQHLSTGPYLKLSKLLIFPTLSCSSGRVDMQSLFQHSTTGKVPQFLQNVVVSQNVGVKCRWVRPKQIAIRIETNCLPKTWWKDRGLQTWAKKRSWKLVKLHCAAMLVAALLSPMFDPKPEATIKSTESNGFLKPRGPKLRPHMWLVSTESTFCTGKLKQFWGSQSENFQASMPFYHSLLRETLKQVLLYDLSHCLKQIFEWLWSIVKRKIERACLGSWRARSLCPILKQYLDAQAEVPSERLIFPTFEGQTGVESHH